jgi:shikimate kinase
VASPTKPNLFLIGYRGTGKTTVAPLVAARLGWAWGDADQLLEQRHGQTIRDIFTSEGEAGFRVKETAILEELCQGRAQVVALGGGVVLDPGNRQRLRHAGFVAWLTADAPTIWQRLQADATTSQRRPALTVGGLQEIEELLRSREPFYRECADLVIDTTTRSPSEVASNILKAFAAESATG